MLHLNIFPTSVKGDSDPVVKDTIVFQVAAFSSWFSRKGRSIKVAELDF